VTGVNFIVVTPGAPVAGELLYDRKGLSFNFRPADPADQRRTNDAVELAFGSLAVSVDRPTGDLLGVWGYAPETSWQQAVLGAPAATPARVRVQLTEVPPSGVSLRLAKLADLTALRDPQSGWLRVGRTGTPSGGTVVEFASGCVAEIAGSELVAVWLRPTR
jgi:hypothetical protein